MTQGRDGFAPGKDQDNGVVRHVCGADCGGGVDQDSRSGGSVYPAVFVYHAGGDSVGGKARGAGGLRLPGAGIGRAADLCPGRRAELPASAQLWLPHRICRRRLCHRDNGPKRAGDLPAAAGSQFSGAWGCLPVWDALLLRHLSGAGHPHWDFGRCFCMDLCWPSPGIWCCVWWGLFWACACFPA